MKRHAEVRAWKTALAWWLRERTMVSLRWVSEELVMGHYMRASQAVCRLQRKRGRKLERLKRRRNMVENQKCHFSRTDPFKEWNANSGLYYYLYRFYDPALQRWSNKDPIQEQGGINLYEFAGNNSANNFDLLGLDNTAGPWTVGWQWLTGTGPRSQNFGNDDPFTEMLQQHEWVEETRQKIEGELAAQCASCNKTPLQGNNNYELGGLQGVPKYFRDYSTLLTGGLTGNLAVTYLGSYQLSYQTTRIDCKDGIGQVHFHAFNVSSIASATHPPVIGYTSVWNTYIGSPLNNVFSSGPMSATQQTFDWDELLSFKGNSCCKN
jgi:RHS repeat-associated protein